MLDIVFLKPIFITFYDFFFQLGILFSIPTDAITTYTGTYINVFSGEVMSYGLNFLQRAIEGETILAIFVPVIQTILSGLGQILVFFISLFGMPSYTPIGLALVISIPTFVVIVAIARIWWSAFTSLIGLG